MMDIQTQVSMCEMGALSENLIYGEIHSMIKAPQLMEMRYTVNWIVYWGKK